MEKVVEGEWQMDLSDASYSAWNEYGKGVSGLLLWFMKAFEDRIVDPLVRSQAAAEAAESIWWRRLECPGGRDEELWPFAVRIGQKYMEQPFESRGIPVGEPVWARLKEELPVFSDPSGFRTPPPDAVRAELWTLVVEGAERVGQDSTTPRFDQYMAELLPLGDSLTTEEIQTVISTARELEASLGNRDAIRTWIERDPEKATTAVVLETSDRRLSLRGRAGASEEERRWEWTIGDEEEIGPWTPSHLLTYDVERLEKKPTAGKKA